MRWVALLRGINVGGNKSIKMADLRELLHTLGLEQVQTLLQSGNVLLESNLPSEHLRDLLETQLETHFGFSVRVILRNTPDFSEVIAQHPFSLIQLNETAKIGVLFFQSSPKQQLLTDWLMSYRGTEQLYYGTQHLYIFYTDGMGNSKLSHTVLEKQLKRVSTMRNWNTLQKLLTALQSKL